MDKNNYGMYLYQESTIKTKPARENSRTGCYGKELKAIIQQ